MAYPASKPMSNRRARSASLIPRSLALEQSVAIGHRRAQCENSIRKDVVEALPLRGKVLSGRFLWSSHLRICGLIVVCYLRAFCEERCAYERPVCYLVRYGGIPDGTRKLLVQIQ